jgi:CheY-like chemotaxis protein
MKRILVLEDDSFRARFFIERYGQHRLRVIENAQAAIEYLKANTYDYIFLDNDLGEGNGEGQDVANFLHMNPTNPNNNARIIIHSWNIPAAERMKTKLPRARRAMFNTAEFHNLNLDI